jgi:3-deoxy-D-manno-octulosonic-acid transferase
VYLLYDLILLVAAAVLIPWYLLRGLRHGKVRRGIRERLGLYEDGRLASLAGREVIWVHAVSVGETRAAIPLLRALKAAYPQSALVMLLPAASTTPTFAFFFPSISPGSSGGLSPRSNLR